MRGRPGRAGRGEGRGGKGKRVKIGERWWWWRRRRGGGAEERDMNLRDLFVRNPPPQTEKALLGADGREYSWR